ncbi:MAG: imidazole glycerol phosphate synthase subunit HisH [Spirochaetales bacterium]|nr:imidazole glycerol phosphate synthase subunit HisH [Spirochaetales bacterium]
MTGIVDYNAGNLKSVETALRFLQVDFFISCHPGDFKKADRLIFPGVGDAQAAMKILSSNGLGETITGFYREGKPVLGICLGCQIIFTHSEEGDTACLDLIQGEVIRFPAVPGYKVPHMGWNQVIHLNRHPVFRNIPDNSSFYFVHSYFPKPDNNSCIAGETEYSVRFSSAVGKNNLIAVQFHPEKSGKNGLTLLSNFLKWKGGQ